jgi:hypothetical protein
MSRRSSVPLLVATAASLCLSMVACEPGSSPSAPNFDKPGGVRPDAARPSPAHGVGGHHSPGRPMRGRLKAFDTVWVVSHFAEQVCNGRLVAGTEVRSSGNLTHLGKSDASASLAWDWAVPAAGNHTPQGPTTNSSATILGSYPYTFCSDTRVATGEVVLEAANGDEVHGVVSGGEVYELGYDVPGDGQEQFMEVEFSGGTGRFRSATGSIVIHSIVRFDGSLALNEILPGGTIQY